MRSVDDLTAIPATITAGDSYGIVLSYSDYPATSGWSVAFAIAGPSVQSWTSTADDDAHRLTLTTDETGALSAGVYTYRVRVTDGTDSRTVDTGTVTVAADVGALVPGAATTWEETTLAVVKAALAGTLEGEMAMYMIGGRQVMTFKPSELMELLDTLQARVDRMKAGFTRGTMQFTSNVTTSRSVWC